MTHGNRNLVADRYVEEMITLYQSGTSLRELSKLFGFSRTLIGKRIRENGIDTTPKRYTVNHNFFSKINSEETAYWLGFITADGCVTDNRLRMGLHAKDKSHLLKLKRSLSSDHKLYKAKYRKAFKLDIRSNKIVTDLFKYGIFPRKSLSQEPYILPDHLAKHYWRGVIDGDGGIYVENEGNYPKIYLCGTFTMCQAFKEFSTPYSNSPARVRPIKSIFQYAVKGKSAIPIIKLLYKDANVYLDRKYDLAMKILT